MDQEIEDSASDDTKGYPTDGQNRQSIEENLFKTNDDWNSIYVKHKQAVENRIVKDYEKYAKESNKRRCSEFSDKVCGFSLFTK